MENPYKIEFKGTHLNVSIKDGEITDILMCNYGGGYTKIYGKNVKLVHPNYLTEIKKLINEKYNH